ncbi:head-tail joining protein [Wolbachia endosymbiont of Ctenocephalides felis wCfeT]|uniref:head-tail joining protein n=1 Tax=Wolbachia endosymbiont of Ctenocephalides felis wCfeT TaxID=2732593 RepID=UPI0014459929|nr:hypothetical protein [Wolbachia endosymbiont of Ctenocephalides felis wCfeT]
MNILKLFTDCFEHLGVEVVYCNQNKQPICKIKALVKRPDSAYSLGADGKFTQQIASIEIRTQDIGFLSVGDYIKIDGKYYKIFEPPLKGSSNNLWEITAMEV